MKQFNSHAKKKERLGNESASSTHFLPSLITSETKTFKSELKQIIRLIEDDFTEENVIIDHIKSTLAKCRNEKEMRASFQVYRDGDTADNFTLLHYAAKKCRPFVCKFLVDEIGINKDSLTKRKMNALHVLIKCNIFRKQVEKSGDASNRDSSYSDALDDDYKALTGHRFSSIYDKKKTFKLLTSESFRRDKDNEEKHLIKFKKSMDILIDINVNLNEQDEFGLTPLHYAVIYENMDAALILSVLGYEKIDLEIKDRSNMTALEIACKHGNEEMASLLIDKTNIEQFVNATNPNFALHFSCKYKRELLLLVKKLLERVKTEAVGHLANILQRLDNNSKTILGLAIDNNHLNIVDLLLRDYYADVDLRKTLDKNGHMPIHLAAKNGSVDLLNILVKNDAVSFKVNSNGDNALHIAAENNKYQFIKEFLFYEKSYIEKNSLQGSHLYCANTSNRDGLHPLYLAIINGHTKCVEILATLDYAKLDAQDKNGNTIFHACAEFNNQESLRYMAIRKDPRVLKALYIKNKKSETVLHTASFYENLEIIKLVLSRIYDGFMPTETFLKIKNKEGKTFFHLACQQGCFNIVEYFLKDLKIKYLVELLDKEMNSPLHIASNNNHLSIVNLLIDFGADMNVKNKAGHTALELSCRKGFFEISKTLINRNPTKFETDDKVKDDPLHVACVEGSYEVVRLLLAKGVPIDILTNENKNCLDIAIEKGHRDVIKVLLKDPNWEKLFQSEVKENGLIIESPQFNAMYENKMWELIRIVLDNSQDGENFNFKTLDPKCRNVNTHPLTLLAKSGQETLLKHDTTLQLLNLKWRFIPRLIFYSSLLFYLIFLILFSLYTVDIHQDYLNQINAANSSDANKTANISTTSLDADETDVVSRLRRAIAKQSTTFSNTGDGETKSGNKTTANGLVSSVDSNLTYFLLVVIALISLKKLLQIILISRLSFFTSLPDWIECLTYVLAFVTVIVKDIETKFSCASIAILLAFFVLLFLIQKLQIFGLFVLAFNKTMIKSATFLPVFLIIYAGFTLSYRLRSHFGVSYFNTQSESLSIIRTFSMVTGDFSGSDMGIEDWSFVNYLLYCLFISVMCIIILNMLVGIAVGEITTILNEADIQQISMRIIFVMKCQDVLKNVSEKPSLRKYASLRFEKYTYDDEYTLIKMKDKIIDFLVSKFSSKDPEIKLDDPQKRLEDNLTELARITNEDLKRIREGLSNQINDVAAKLGNSQQRLEDSLLESSRKNVNNLEITKEDSSTQLTGVKAELEHSQNQILLCIKDVYSNTNIKLIALRQSIAARFRRIEQRVYPHQKKLETNIDMLLNGSMHLIRTSNDEFTNLKEMNTKCLSNMEDFLAINKSLLNQSENILEINNGLVNQLNQFQVEIYKTNHEIKDLLEAILAAQHSRHLLVPTFKSEWKDDHSDDGSSRRSSRLLHEPGHSQVEMKKKFFEP